MTEHPARVLIAGAGSSCFWNTGDEAILAGMLAELRSAIPSLEVSLASRNPQGFLARYNLREIPLGDIQQLMDAASSSDLLILGGGGIFYDYWGTDPSELLTPRQSGLALYAGFALMATLLNKPLMVYGVGVGPLLSAHGRRLTKTALQQADLITVRDPGSGELVRSLGIDPDRIQVTADPAFSLALAGQDRARQILRAEVGARPARPILGVAVREWDIGVDPEIWEAHVAQALDRFITDRDGLVIFIPFHRSDGDVDDEAAARRIRQRMANRDGSIQVSVDYTPEEKGALLGACDLVLGMRLHAIVYAIATGTPFVALPYDPKVSAMADLVDLSAFSLKIDKFNAGDLTGLLNRALDERSQIKEALAHRAAQFRLLASKNADGAAELLTSRRAKPSPPSPEMVEQLKSTLISHTRKLHALQLANDQLSSALNEKERLIADMLTSRAWRLLQILRRLRRRVAPDGSRRHVAVQRWLEVFGSLFSFDLRRLRRALVGPSAPAAAPKLDAGPAQRGSFWNLLGPLRRVYLRLPAPIRARALPVYRRLMGPQLGPMTSSVVAEAAAQPELRREARWDVTLEDRQLRVPILAPAFFNAEGNDMFAGGAERYLIELERLIRSLGYSPEVYQPAAGSWVRYYGEMRVTGIDTGCDVSRLNQAFHAQVPPGRLNIYLAFYLADPQCHPNAIGISHGIFWDNPGVQSIPDVQRQSLSEVLNSFANLSHVVSVDTNTINWVRSVRFELSDRFTYIPNFVDVEQFRPAAGAAAGAEAGRTVILYPRRLYPPRGFWLVAEIVPDLLKEHPDTEFHFVGKANPPEREAVEQLMRRYPDRVRWYDLPPHRMHEAYQRAQITLIPTVSSEGTSLSCLEAMACENAVIATNVGGLPDLLLHNYNGLLVEPRASAIESAVSKLVRDPDLRTMLGRRGREVAHSFNIDRWRAEWRRILSEHLPDLSPAESAPTPPVAIFPAAPGVSWEPIKQRPHHLAIQLAAHGIETFWGNPEGRRASPFGGLHIVSQEDELHPKRPLVFIYYPFHYEKLKDYDDPIVIYDVLDDISIHDWSDAQAQLPPGRRARDYHQRLLAQADVVMTSSRTLQERLRQDRSDAILVPNGVDLAHFSSRGLEVAAALLAIEPPIIGYHGAIAEWLDIELLQAVLRLRQQYRFVLMGPCSIPRQLERLRAEPNLRYLGNQPYDEIPRFVAGFDLGIIPFVIDRITQGVRPLKALECLAMGKPVVATPLPELQDWPGVFLADSPQAWAEQIDRALASRSKIAGDPQVRAFVGKAAWSETAKPLLEAIQGLPRSLQS